MKNFRTGLVLFCILLCISLQSQIVIDFCPVDKNISASAKQWNATMTIQNNTGVVLEFTTNKLKLDWPSLVSLPYPFQNFTQSGITWEFEIAGVSTWDSKMPVGATWSKAFAGGLYSGVLQFPSSGTFTQGGTTYTVTVNHCAKTEPYELYNATVDFNRDCFIKSPTSNMCLGEGATEVWQGEGVFDAMFPADRPSWAIGTMVAHRLFTNMAGVEMLSPNFWTATALNESRMVCDPTIVPDLSGNHWGINTLANIGTGIDTRTDNCFQVLNIGYSQLQNNQPDLFSQTNAYGTASYNTVIAGGKYETGALAVAYYHYQDIRYWNQIFCWNAKKFHKDAVDPYAVEKVFYHAFHDGPNAGISLLNDIDANYAAAIAATNMNTVIATGGTWSALGGGSSQKVGNFTSLLDGAAANLYPTTKIDATTEYYGCYEESIKWADILFYLDKVKILYPQLMDATEQAAIKAVFDGLNGGGNVMFTNLGPVIDEIVIQMGGHDPSSYLATQYSASKVCTENPVGVSLRTNDTLCPGESGFLQVWVAGDPAFRVDIKFPDGTTNSYTGITSSPYNIAITQPGDYEVVYFEDADEVGDINCNFAKVTVESKNGNVVGWDKTNLDAVKNCATGDLIVTKTGNEQVSISYTKDGVAQTDIVMLANETTKTIATGVVGGQYIITTLTPNSCGVPINDTITFCSSCTKPPYAILTPDTSICAGDTVQVRIALTGTQPYTLYFTPTGLSQVTIPNIINDYYNIPISIAGTVTIDSLVDNTCTNDTAKSLTITINALPTVSLGNDTVLCGSSLTLDAGVGQTTYEWNGVPANNTQTFAATTTGANNYIVKVTNAAGCVASDTINVTLSASPTVSLGNDTSLCSAALPLSLDGTTASATYVWNDASTNPTLSANAAGTYWVIVTVNNCSDTDSIAVTVNGSASLVLGNDTTICGTSFLLDGGAGHTTYEWQETPANNTQNFSAATSGSNDYILKITNASGCEVIDTINVTLNPKPTALDIRDTSLCLADLPVSLDATQGGVSYLWNDATTNPTLSANAAGDYWVIVTQNNCSDTDSVTVSLKGAATVNLGNDTTLCGASLTLDAGTGQTTYEWMESAANNAQTFTANTAGINEYRVKVTNADGCESRDTINVTLNIPPTVSLGPDTSKVCPTSYPVVFDATTASATYVWNDASTNPTLNANAQGDYWVIVTVNGCSDTDSVYVQESSTLSLDLGLDTTVCPGQTITLTPTVNYSNIAYTWNDGSNGTSLTTSAAGKIYLDIVGAGGCAGTDTMELFNNNPLVISLGTDIPLCLGDSTNLELTPARTGLNYVWDAGGPQLSTDSLLRVGALGTTTYTLAVDSAGCTFSDDIIVTVNSLPTVSLGTDTFVCKGSSATVTLDAGTGHSSYLWSDATSGQTISVGTPGAYHVVVTDANGCSNSDTINLTQEDTTVFELGNPQIVCPGATTNIAVPASLLSSGLGSGTFVWSDASSVNPYVISKGKADGYSELVQLTYTNDKGCISTDTLSVTIKDELIVSITGNQDLCEGESLPNSLRTTYYGVSNFRDYTYEWTDGTPVTTTGSNYPVNNVAKGDHGKVITVIVTDTVLGCSGTAPVTLTVNAMPVPGISGDTKCLGASVTLTSGLSAPTYTFGWTKNGATIPNTASTYTIDGSTAEVGTYAVTATALGCSGTSTTVVTINALPTVTITGDTGVACVGEVKTIFTPLVGTYQYNWTKNGSAFTPAETTNSLTLSTDGTYAVTVFDLGTTCTDTKSTTISFSSPPNVDFKDDSLINLCAGSDTVIYYDDYDVSRNYVWSNGETNTDKISITSFGVYSLTETVGNCTDTGYIIVLHRELPISGLQKDTVVCFEDMVAKTMVLDSKQNNSSYLWNTGAATQSISIEEQGYFEVAITTEYGCKTIDGVVIEEDCQANIWMPAGFTPNGDGVNDVWGVSGRGIETVEAYVYNRWGELIWKGTSTNDYWDGKVNNHPVAQDVYVWQVSYTYKSSQDGSVQSRNQTGIVTVIR